MNPHIESFTNSYSALIEYDTQTENGLVELLKELNSSIEDYRE